jgi:hypothetical protein
MSFYPANKMRFCFFIFTMAFLCIVGIILLKPGMVNAEAGQTAEKPDVQRLEGSWVRPDGGYLLELRDIKKDGSLKASYANPSRRVKVFSAKWNREKGQLRVFVELRDVNYPGSKYDLQYDPMSDRLKGTYFQAVEQQTYNVEFERPR